ncbi:MGMT family protein [Devosia sp. PTR5]|uniref:methylated-DNA--[protein]-cysteine S-methyltransferase n=1 Tax=Devosia oryzisoli TaxID=2774138 RepID=A0A927FQV5_9HYPH|nr:methylated-DNA--[protein]-cysteine S-methyltransferase [Devosia oryzisoli]MBD8064361.1 MGMT family protein [Devosia oryzisoli]
MWFAIASTDLGEFGFGWSSKGIARLNLPGEPAVSIAERFVGLGYSAAVPPEAVSELIQEVRRYCEGQKVEFQHVALDLTGVSPFYQRVYARLRELGWGKTTTYGDLAAELGDVRLARAIGQAMGANPVPLIIPCHRVLASSGKPGGFSAPGGTSSKLRMLALEGVQPGAPIGQLGFGF